MFGTINCCDTYVGTTARINIGDNFQFLALEHIYDTLGLTSHLKEISLKDLHSYHGESLIVPLNWSIFDSNWMDGNKLSISPDIKPLFLAVTLGVNHKDSYFNPENIEYLKANGPIGCRDEVTYRKLLKYDIPCYLNGCLTLTIPARACSGNFIYFVDTPLSLANKIPHDFLQNARFTSHQVYYSSKTDPKLIVQNIKKQYDDYKQNAKLVITSRLHAAAPCVAMGIPVIFVKEIIDERFSWLDKILPLYSLSDWDNINWFPAPADIDFIKSKMLECAQKRILGQETSELQQEITNFWLDRPKRHYEDFRKQLFENFDPIFQWLSVSWTPECLGKYSIWGVTRGAEKLVSLISEKYPNSQLCSVVDSYRTESFLDRKITRPEELLLTKDEKLLVLAAGASPQARDFMKCGRIDPLNCFLLSDNFITSEEDLLLQKAYVQRYGHEYTSSNG